jgi:hypothetical protein
MQNSTFEQDNSEEIIDKCPNCNLHYSIENDKIPLILPCGHIICKTCLIEISNLNKLISCPIDTKIFTHEISSFEIFQPFLQKIQKKKKLKEFICSIHNDKKIKYICEYDNETFCSKCLINHNQYPHKILNFEPNKERINDDIEIVSKQINCLKEDFNSKNKKLDEFQNLLKRKLQEESFKLKNEIKKIINSFLEIQKLYEEKIFNLYNFQCDKIEESKLNINLISNEIKSLNEKIILFQNKYSNKMNIIYNEIIEEKNDIIYNYEQLKRQNILNSNQFEETFEQLQLPKIIFHNEKNIMNYTQNLIVLDSENYLNKIKNHTENRLDCLDKRSESSERNSNKKITSLRKGSDPTSQTKFYNRFTEGKDNKPVLINDNQNIITSQFYVKYNKNNNNILKKNTMKKRGLSKKSGTNKTNNTTSTSKQSKQNLDFGF